MEVVVANSLCLLVVKLVVVTCSLLLWENRLAIYFQLVFWRLRFIYLDFFTLNVNNVYSDYTC